MQAQHHIRKTGLAIMGLAILTTLTGCTTLPPPNQAENRSQQGLGMTARDDRNSLEELRDAELAREHAEARAREAEIAMARARAMAGMAREHAEARSREAETALARARELESRLVATNETTGRQQITRSQPADRTPPAEMQQTARGMVLTLGDVLFDSGKAELKPGAARTLTRVSEFLAAHPGHTALIEGHTDNTGDTAFNRRLSLQRAESVRDALVLRGVAAQRINVRGLGYDYPIASNTTSLGRQKNRRVEIIISDQSGRVPEPF
ncbi:OmpA family protein [Ectothiorhodospira shaposhnikovii]|uniref:OmpA family protein n=1 Tax=Ectothiorhodospira shaposhnikovii TaxID=1054 RepID=UPI0019089F5C|nr:OmpA family protein [Ectothiorhodospira shaposhnikovii]